MTKTQWKNILEELKTIRSTNKFRTLVYYDDGITPSEKIEQVDTRSDRLILGKRCIIGHQDVIDTSPNDFKKRFYFTQNVFAINTIQFN